MGDAHHRRREAELATTYKSRDPTTTARLLLKPQHSGLNCQEAAGAGALATASTNPGKARLTIRVGLLLSLLLGDVAVVLCAGRSLVCLG
jgi:hypothetical protein